MLIVTKTCNIDYKTMTNIKKRKYQRSKTAKDLFYEYMLYFMELQRLIMYCDYNKWKYFAKFPLLKTLRVAVCEFRN